MSQKKITIFTILFTVVFLLFGIVPAQAALGLSQGWNLASSIIPITVNQTFSDDTKFTSVWKWESSGWTVYLPGETTPGSYAEGKGFAVLSTISSGEGFWVNAVTGETVTVTGTEETSNTLTLVSGWNLKGLTTSNSITVSSVFSDSAKFTSIWKWASGAWAVYLPGETTPGSYAQGKGFAVLSTIASGEGFWVNAQSSGDVDVSGVATPPLVGKVSEVIGKNDKNSYKAVPGAVVSIDGVSAGTTDSLGAFETTNYSGSSVKVDVTLDGYVPFSETVTIPDSNQIYVFIQKKDTNSEELESTEIVGKFFIGPQKPTPKVITSSDNTISITITNMKLTNDITVAVTPYKALNTIPDIDKIADLGLGNVDIVGGGTISIVDANGDPTTGEAAGFSAKVSPKTTKVLGKWDLDKLQTKTAEGGTGQLYLLSKTSSGWKKVGNAKVEQKDNSSVKSMVPGSGVIMGSLDAFIFALATTDTVKENQITGKVVETGTATGIGGVYVGVDGFFNETITDESGNFTLDFVVTDQETLNLQVIFLYAWKDGYYAGSKEIPADAQAVDLTDITVEMEKFGEITTISGHVYNQSQSPIANALVTLKTPSVLDEIVFDEDRIYVGKSDDAFYKWEILEEPATPFGTPTVLKTIPPTKGRNYLGKEDAQDILSSADGDLFLLISLEVTHKVGQSEFKEQAMGMLFVYDFGGQQEVILDFMPDFTNFSIMEALTDSQGAYEFYGVEKDMLPFLKACAKASGYKRSDFAALPAAQSGTVTQDFNLAEQVVAASYTEDFELAANTDQWTVKLTSQDQDITTSNAKWQLLENPDQVAMPAALLDQVMFSDMGWIDVEGTIGTIDIDDLQSDEFWKVGKATVTWQENGQNKTLKVLLYDYEGPDGTPDGKYEWIEPDYTLDQDYYELWIDYGALPTGGPDDFWSMSLENGSSIMVSYQGTAEGQDAGLNLLPAISGSKVFWFGNQASTDYTGTYYDPDLQTAEQIVDAFLTSPVIDLSNFSYATLQMESWFEVNGANYSSMALEVAIVDDTLADGESVALISDFGDTTVKKGEFVPLAQFNSFAMMGLGAFGAPGTESTGFPKEASPKKALLAEVVGDNDFDGLPDTWEATYSSTCGDSSGHVDPYGDLDGDWWFNIEEFLAETNPCDIDSYPIDEDFDYLPDSWEAQYATTTCTDDGTGGFDPWGDADNDFWPNIDEFYTQSDPCDDTSPGGGIAPMGFEDFTIGLSSGGEFAPPVWMPYEYNLGPFAGHKIKLRFKFSFVNNSGNLFRGWALDDVKILDTESDLYFEILTPEFGYFGDTFINPVTQGESWLGDYVLKFSNGEILDLSTWQVFDFTAPDQTITVTQEGLWVDSNMWFNETLLNLEGSFWDESYDQFNFYFYDAETGGNNMSGWGDLFRDPVSGEISGYIGVYDIGAGYEYTADIILEVAP